MVPALFDGDDVGAGGGLDPGAFDDCMIFLHHLTHIIFLERYFSRTKKMFGGVPLGDRANGTVATIVDRITFVVNERTNDRTNDQMSDRTNDRKTGPNYQMNDFTNNRTTND